MITIIGVRFRKSGKVYYFDPAGSNIEKGNHVIVETARGVEYGLVVLAPKEVTDDKVVKPLKPIIRIATPEDAVTNEKNEKEEKEAFAICLEKIQKHGLEMKLIDSEYTFDKNKLLFYFTADGRIDFRELVKDLAAVFRTRIELRQIGVRDETKMVGGIAICGRPLCCHTFLADFAPVSIKMAKEQNLSLNPSKISGVCGRLMCCLKNEEEAYEYLNSTLPHVGAEVATFDGFRGEVQSISVLKQKVKVIISKDNDEKEVREYAVNELQFDNHNRPAGIPVGQILPDEEIDENALKELEQLEIKDLEDATEEAEQNTRTGKNQQGKRRNYNRNNYRNDSHSRNYNRTDRESYQKNNQNESYSRENQGDSPYQHDGRENWRENRKDNRKYKKYHQENNQNHHNYKRNSGDSLFDEENESWGENKNKKSRYRNSHNSHRGIKNQGRR